MADATTIEWMIAVARSRGTRPAVWNPIRGCRPASEGCRNCWAATVANMRQNNPQLIDQYQGLTAKAADGRPVFNGATRLIEKNLDLPLRTKKPTVYFVCSESDLFGEAVEDEWIDQVFAVEALCEQHLFIHLTKRAARMRAYFAGIPEMPDQPAARDAMVEGAAQNIYQARTGEDPALWLVVHLPLPNAWFGVSVEDQAAADERIPDLLETPAALRWISAEPLLGQVDLIRIGYGEDTFDDCGGHPESDRGAVATGWWWDVTTGNFWSDNRNADGSREGLELIGRYPRIDWIVAGGESGPHARPMHPDWARSLRDQCAATDVPFFFKQWGEYHPSAEHDPDPRRCGDTPEAIHVTGDREFRPGEQYRLIASKAPGWAGMCRIGKKAAGHLLDSKEHLEVPNA
ncbi:phage Gp37/Gp68 family protein [Telmatospirillum sp.]|uniref:phage Gp37/Gp68 family protein n=1 Tax=Telmatospirillum sp. TaxID=2079197 RepID=UPI00283E2F1A|nr:phage Gp37/Gp68 family protein [Telmatospirillum sp.]MDR3438995.1 phage Gp37/Gp68 family protein [Telmatospirillum sp.]